MITERSRAAHSASAESLARCALDVLRGVESTALVAAHLQRAVDEQSAAGSGAATVPRPAAVAVAAVRMLGADVLAPLVLTGQGLRPEEAAAVRLALGALPSAQYPPAAPPKGPELPWIRAWIDWGLVTVLARLDPGSPGDPAPAPPGPPCCEDGAPRRGAAPAAGDCPSSRGEGWVPWSLRMGQLASLALPGLDGPVHDAARSGVLALARGAVRAFLRRDFATAARLTRWLAWLAADGAVLPLDVASLTRDISLCGGDDRCLLDAALARSLLGLENL